MDIYNLTQILRIASYMMICLGGPVAIVSFIADHRRRRRQATFDFYHNIYTNFMEHLKVINKIFPKEDYVIPVSDVEDNPDIAYAIRTYLSCMERFAIGINKGIYDIKVFERTVGAIHTVKLFARFEKFIEDFREKNNCPSVYEDLHMLVSKIKYKSVAIGNAGNTK